MWHMSSRSGVATLRTAIHLLLSYLQHGFCVIKNEKLYLKLQFPKLWTPTGYWMGCHRRHWQPLWDIGVKWLITRNKKSKHFSMKCINFVTARCYASAVLAMAVCLSVCPSVCRSVCLSVTSRCFTKTAKRRITQTITHDSPGTLVFCSQRSPRNSTGVTPYGDAKCRWGGSKSAIFDK